MPVYIALLRAVNLGGVTQVPMSDVRAGIERLGFENVRSILQSGNLVFEGDRAPTASVERRIESEIGGLRARPIDVFVRSAAEWRTVVKENPFPREAIEAPGHLHVAALKDEPGPAEYRALDRAIVGREVARPGGRQVYLVYPDGVGRSKLSATVIERALGTRTTARNWNTVVKLDRLASG